MIKRKIILASQSPRRKQLLQELGFDFQTVKIDCEEIIPENFDVENLKYKNLSKEDKEDSESISRLLENSRQSATLQTDSNTSTTQTTTTSSHSANSSEQSPQMLKQFKKVGRPATETVSKKSEQSCRIN